ncbi:MAG: methylmalonyl-CoA mutase family protein [Rikenellaceae bacterium]
MSEKTKLMNEFPPITKEQWEAVITTDLKGADRSRKLVWRTLEGFDVEPYYRAEDLENLQHLGSEPGEFPYVRGIKSSNEWLVRQTITVDCPAQANKEALAVLFKGVTSLGFVIGNKEFSAEDLDTLLENIQFKAVELAFSGCAASKVAELFLAKVKAAGLDTEDVRATFANDPLSRAAKKGSICGKAFGKIAELIKAKEGYNRVRMVGVNGALFNDCGANATQELAFSLAAAHEYIVKLMDEGLTIEQVAGAIKFNMSVSSNYFMEIAKFRAARMLWANIVKGYNPSRACSSKMRVHATTSMWNSSVYDPYVNMLRGTTEAMSAAIAGVDSIEVLPFNAAYEAPTEFSSRISRNAQLLLKEESHLDAVVDPSAGSYYIETLTSKIAQSAWSLFKQVEDKGGYMAALEAGFVQEQVAASAALRDKNLATRREILLGTNQYPNFTEEAAQAVSEATVAPAKKGCKCKCSGDAKFPVLTPYRVGMAFEQVRLKTDRSDREINVFMLTCGSLSFARARAQFACNYFACAGFKVQDNTYFNSVAQGAAAAIEAKADITVICASDADYATLAVEAYELLKEKSMVVVAGAPECAEELKAAGITHFIAVRDNVLESLKAYQAELGI